MQSAPIVSSERARGTAAANSRILALAILTLLAAVALLLVARRSTGAFDTALPVGGLLLLSVLFAGAAHAARRLWSAAEGECDVATHNDGRLRLAVAWLPAVCLLAMFFTLWLPETSIAALFMLLALFVAEEAWSL